MIKEYYELTKPRMVYGNVFIAACGFFLASRGIINGWLFLATITGLSLVIAAGCVINNYIDSGIDKKMARTKNRALVKKLIPKKHALIYGCILAILGISILLIYTNLVTLTLAGLGFLFYVIFYSIWKRRSVHGTLVGSISGAMPPVIGYCAVTNNFDLGALLLIILLVLWQLPHFYSIAIYRFDDYAAAKIPVMPVKKGFNETREAMLVYIIAFFAAVLAFNFLGYTGKLYLFIGSLLCTAWLALCIKGFRAEDTKKWARKMFFLSLIVLMCLFLIIAIDSFLRG